MPRLLERRWYGPRIFEIYLERDTWNFKPGDATLLVLPDRITSRPYSISTHPTDKRLGFLIRLLPEGTVSAFLAHCPIGTEIGTSPPFGQLDLSNPGDMVWIASGTGISPFLSALRGPTDNPPLRLLYGVRFLEDAAELPLLRRASPLSLFVSGEKTPNNIYGRIPADSKLIPVNTRYRYAVCGHGALAQSITERLTAAGISRESIQQEVFFPA